MFFISGILSQRGSDAGLWTGGLAGAGPWCLAFGGCRRTSEVCNEALALSASAPGFRLQLGEQGCALRGSCYGLWRGDAGKSPERGAGFCFWAQLSGKGVEGWRSQGFPRKPEA